MKPAERCKQLEVNLRELQDMLQARDKEIAELRGQRDRLIAERRADRERERERERERDRERERERERDKEREREWEREKERARERDKDWERELEKERAKRERDRDRSSSSFRRSRSQAPSSIVSSSTVLPHYTPSLVSSFSALSIDTETTAHARSLDVFLTKTDGWSGAQVIQAVEDLNAEITHFAASATETCVFNRRAAQPLSARRRSRTERESGLIPAMSVDEAVNTAPWLGAGLAKVLSTHDHASDPLLVQLALQASVATCCARSLSLFCVGFPSKLDTLLSRIYAQMQGAGKYRLSSLLILI